jgi:hypothetical protein
MPANKIRLSGAFVTRFYQEWERAGDAMLHTWHNVTEGEKHQRVERFLSVMLPLINGEMLKQEVPRDH